MPSRPSQWVPSTMHCPRTLEEANGHCADEKLKLADLYAATAVIALTLRDLLSTSR